MHASKLSFLTIFSDHCPTSMQKGIHAERPRRDSELKWLRSVMPEERHSTLRCHLRIEATLIANNMILSRIPPSGFAVSAKPRQQ